MDKKHERFLIVRLGAIGDIIHTLPCADLLRKTYNKARIDWVVDEKNAKMLADNPNIDNIYTVPLKKWQSSWLKLETIKEILEFGKKLKANNYTWAFDLHGMFKSLVIMLFCGAKNRVVYTDYREFATFGGNVFVKPKAKRPYRNYSIIQRYLDLIQNSGLEYLDENYEPKSFLPYASKRVQEKITKALANLDSNKKTIIFAPKTTWDNKHWDKNEWRKLYQYLKNDYNIVFSGVMADLELIGEIIDGDNACVMAGKTNLEEYIELIRRADLVISPDSSASHIAWAVQDENKKPQVVTIFCATSKHTFSTPNALTFPKEDQVCTPCHKRKCKFKHQNCTKQTTAKEVYDAIVEVLTKN